MADRHEIQYEGTVSLAKAKMNTVYERVFISFPFLDDGPNYLKILVVWGIELAYSCCGLVPSQ